MILHLYFTGHVIAASKQKDTAKSSAQKNTFETKMQVIEKIFLSVKNPLSVSSNSFRAFPCDLI